MNDRLSLAVAELIEALREDLRGDWASPTTPDRLLGVVDASRLLGIGRTATYRLIDSGSLRSIKVGRRRLVAQSAVDAFIAGQAT